MFTTTQKDKLVKEYEDKKTEFLDVQKSKEAKVWLDKIIKEYGKDRSRNIA
jgi:hypothetical protein